MGIPPVSARSVLLIVGAALLFRVTACAVPRFNVDEGWAYYVSANPVDQVLHFLVKDRHPPIHYLALGAWHEMVGAREFPLRLPGVLLATLAVWLVFLVGREISGATEGLMAAGLYAVSFLAWEYDTWMRNYHLLSAFGLLSTLMFLHVMRGGGWRPAAAYVAASVVLIYSHYFGFLVLAAHAFYTVWAAALAHREGATGATPPWKTLAACWLATAVLFLPWAPFLQEQLARRAARDLAAGPDPVRAVMMTLHVLPMMTGLEHLPALLGISESLPLWGAVGLDIFWTLLLGAICWNGLRRRSSTPYRPLLLALLAPVPLLLLAVGVKFPELCRPRYYACFVPYLGMLLANGVPLQGVGRRLTIALAILVVGINLAVLADYVRRPYFRAADWHTPVRWVEARGGSAQAITFYDNYTVHAFNFYYAGDLVQYDIRDIERPSLRYSPEYAAGGRLPELRLWPEEFPEPAATTFRGVDRAFLVLWYETRPEVRRWFSEHYGVVDALSIPNYAPDGRADIYHVQRTR